MPILDRADFHRNIERMMESQTRQPDQFLLVEERASFNAHATPIAGGEYVLCDEAWVSYTEKKIRGLAAATGDLIVIMSSDDYYSPRYLEIWEQLFRASNAQIIRFQSHWVYNIVDRRYGLVGDVSGGHSAYMRDWARAEYDSNENTLNRIDMPRTDKLLGEFAIIRHTPAGEMRDDGFRRSAKLRGHGHTCGTEHTPELDPKGSWLREYIGDDATTDFYLNYGDRARLEYPCAK